MITCSMASPEKRTEDGDALSTYAGSCPGLTRQESGNRVRVRLCAHCHAYRVIWFHKCIASAIRLSAEQAHSDMDYDKENVDGHQGY